MALSALSTLAAAVAANAGVNAAGRVQSAYTVVGGLEAGRKAGAPRITWVPVSEDIEPPNRDETALSKTAFTRKVECAVVIVGQDYDQAELDLHAFLGGLSRTQPLVALPTTADHSEQSLTGALRHEISLRVVVDIPVFRETYTAGLVTGTVHTETLTDP